jgi:hypothetical protein
MQPQVSQQTMPTWQVLVCLVGLLSARKKIDMQLIALVFYEYIITIGDEVRTIWQGKPSISSVFLLSVRWNMVVSVGMNIAPSSASVSQLCIYAQ